MNDKGTDLKDMYIESGIDPSVFDFAEGISADLADRFASIDATAEYNQLKVMSAFREERVSAADLGSTTGYGYGDEGRDKLERIYARVFSSEAALVRPLIACGTHALSIALFGNLRPGDELLSGSGSPYDTLEEVIGIRPSRGSLAEYGVTYSQVDLLPDGSFDLEAIKKAIKPETKMVAIQRSRGYSSRKSLMVSEIGAAISCVKSIRSDIICMVDNCYGEFVDIVEPGDAGADLTVGSLIKNPGGGLAPVGGYICGKKEYVENASYRMTCPGLGSEVGPSLGVNQAFYQGLFLAPAVTASAVKAAVFASSCLKELGFAVSPGPSEPRTDIIEAVTFGSPEGLKAFCRGIQRGAPVDSFVVPEPWDMPGYDDQVIMAAGAFVSGSSIELSADGPMRPPYTAFFQGGITWPSARFGIMSAISELLKEGVISSDQL